MVSVERDIQVSPESYKPIIHIQYFSYAINYFADPCRTIDDPCGPHAFCTRNALNQKKCCCKPGFFEENSGDAESNTGCVGE